MVGGITQVLYYYKTKPFKFDKLTRHNIQDLISKIDPTKKKDVSINYSYDSRTYSYHYARSNYFGNYNESL